VQKIYEKSEERETGDVWGRVEEGERGAQDPVFVYLLYRGRQKGEERGIDCAKWIPEVCESHGKRGPNTKRRRKRKKRR
jgi:hypothetical protein